MKLKNKFIQVWYYPILIAMLSGVVGVILLAIPGNFFIVLGLVLPALAILVSGIMGVIKLFKKQYIDGLLQIICAASLLLAGLLILVLLLTYFPDYFFKLDLDLHIPIRFSTTP